MKVVDHLVFLAEIKGMAARTARQKAGEWLERLGLTDWTSHKVEDLSKGMQQKVQFAGTLLHDPELVLLDEPFSGLDPVNSQVMKDVVIDLARQGKTVLFSTHIMEQAEKMCERVVIISRGRKVVDGTMAEVKREGGGRHVALGFHRDAARAAPVLRDRSLVARVER
jgi:ABC-2 type transport system ATP-binding protein